VMPVMSAVFILEIIVERFCETPPK